MGKWKGGTIISDHVCSSAFITETCRFTRSIVGKSHPSFSLPQQPNSTVGGIAPLQFRTKEQIDMTHMRVFGCPAQIFVRETARMDKKLSNRSVSGTFVGISDKGNGYIFLIRKTNTLVDVDTKDAKFNETFSECRERQGKISPANNIMADLHDATQIDKVQDNDTSRNDNNVNCGNN
jgi:hypothetical protein